MINDPNNNYSIEDAWGLLSVSNPNIITAKEGYSSSVDSVYINTSSFVINDATQSSVDTAPVESYDTNEDNFSLYHTETNGGVGVQIYNPDNEAVTNFVYDVSLPYVGDGNGSEWNAILSSVDVSSVSDATVSYSSDGLTFITNPASLVNVHYVRITIDTIDPLETIEIPIYFSAPSQSSLASQV